MNHSEWIQGRAIGLLRSLGAIERDMEGEALVSLACLSTRSEAYRESVGSVPPSTLDKEVATAYWEAVAKNAPDIKSSASDRERMLRAIERFEEQMADPPAKDSKP